MHFTQVLYITFALANYASAKGLGGGGLGAGYGAGGYGGGGAGAGGYGGGAGGYGGGAGGYGIGKEVPKPYLFGYNAPDEFGNAHYRKEQGDGSGNVQGSYGYTDGKGLYRQVDYLANAGGFKASIKTNEPGTDGKEDPAHVDMNVQHPPAGIQEKYTRGGGSGAYGGGLGSPIAGGIPLGQGGPSGPGFGGPGGIVGGAGAPFAGIPKGPFPKSGY